MQPRRMLPALTQVVMRRVLLYVIRHTSLALILGQQAGSTVRVLCPDRTMPLIERVYRTKGTQKSRGTVVLLSVVSARWVGFLVGLV